MKSNLTNEAWGIIRDVTAQEPPGEPIAIIHLKIDDVLFDIAVTYPSKVYCISGVFLCVLSFFNHNDTHQYKWLNSQQNLALIDITDIPTLQDISRNIVIDPLTKSEYDMHIAFGTLPDIPVCD